MAAEARAVEAVMGREINLFIKKTSEASFVMVGCGNSKDYGGSRNSITLNCDSGKLRLPDGEDPEYDLQLTGFVFEYASGNVATNVSAKEFEQWFQSGDVKEFKLSGSKIGDTVRTFSASITSFRMGASNGEAATYNITLTIAGKPVLSSVTAG